MSGAIRHLRWILPLLTLAVATTVAYAWADSAWTARERARHQHFDLRGEIEQKHRYAANLDAYREQLTTLRALYAELAHRLPSEPIDPALWAALAAESSGVSLIKVERLAEKSLDFYARSDSNVRLTGGFVEFLDFVDALAHVSPTCAPERPRCGGPSHSISRVSMRQQASGVLRIDLDVALFRYLEEEGS